MKNKLTAFWEIGTERHAPIFSWNWDAWRESDACNRLLPALLLVITSSSIVETQAAVAIRVAVGDDALEVELSDGRTISAQLVWYPRLSHGRADERNSWRFIAGGRGILWPMLDEDISVENLLAGKPSGESQASFKKWLETRA